METRKGIFRDALMSTRATGATTRRGRVFKSGQRRGVHGQIKRELRRRPAVVRIPTQSGH